MGFPDVGLLNGVLCLVVVVAAVAWLVIGFGGVGLVVGRAESGTRPGVGRAPVVVDLEAVLVDGVEGFDDAVDLLVLDLEGPVAVEAGLVADKGLLVVVVRVVVVGFLLSIGLVVAVVVFVMVLAVVAVETRVVVGTDLTGADDSGFLVDVLAVDAAAAAGLRGVVVGVGRAFDFAGVLGFAGVRFVAGAAGLAAAPVVLARGFVVARGFSGAAERLMAAVVAFFLLSVNFALSVFLPAATLLLVFSAGTSSDFSSSFSSAGFNAPIALLTMSVIASEEGLSASLVGKVTTCSSSDLFCGFSLLSVIGSSSETATLSESFFCSTSSFSGSLLGVESILIGSGVLHKS